VFPRMESATFQRDTGRAMSQENVEIVARLYNECWGLGKLELVPEILHPDIVWTAIESAPDSGTRRGHVECRAHMNDWLESFELDHAVEEARSAPDGRLVCALHGVGTEKRTGLTTDIRYGAAFRFAPDGRLVEIHEYATHQEALEAAGLRE
jgi:ketosteroid isomerase-like protein